VPVAQAFYSFLFGIVGVVIGWPLVEFIARPFRQFFDIRRQVCRCVVNYGNVGARAEIDRSGKRIPTKLPKADDARLVEAHIALRGLAADMRAFANGEYLANGVVKLFGYDANKIASALMAYSHNIFEKGEDRAKSREQVEKLLGIKSIE
jgi:hypothetical protein